MEKEKNTLTPMQQFVLNVMKDNPTKEYNPNQIASLWYEHINNRPPRAASRDMFGTTSAAYKTCRKLYEKGLVNRVDKRGCTYDYYYYSL